MVSHSPATAPSSALSQPPNQTKGLGVDINSRNVSVWMVGSVALLLIGMAVALFDLWFQSFYYASTDNAFVEGNYVQVGSPGASQVTTVDVKPGDLVSQGQTVATLKLVASSTPAAGPLNYHAKAPRDGIVVGVSVREGQLLTAGQPVVVLTDPDSLWIVANLDEPSLKGVRIGQPAEVQITVLDEQCQGVVTEILPDYAQSTAAAQARSRTTSTLVPVRLDIEGDCPGYTLACQPTHASRFGELSPVSVGAPDRLTAAPSPASGSPTRPFRTLRQDVTALAWPSLVENVLQGMMGVVNMMMVGRLGPVSIGAVGVAQTITFTLQVAYAGLAVGNTALVARSIGAKEPEQAQRIAKQSLTLGAVIATVIIVIGVLFAEQILSLMGAKADLADAAVPYLRIVVCGSVFQMVMFVGGGTLRGAGDTRLPMLIAGFINLINLDIGYTLIFGKLGLPAMGVNGAAVANVIASGAGACVVLYFLSSGRSKVRIDWGSSWRFDFGIIKRLLNIGMPAAGEQVFMRVGMATYSSMVISLGTLVYAAQNIIFTVVSFSFMPGFAFGVAATTMVGQSLGAKNQPRAEESGWEATRLGLIWMTVMGIGFFLFADKLMGVFTTDARVIAYGAPALRLVAWAQPLQAFGMILAGGLRGAGDTRWTMIITTGAIWLVRVPVSYLFGVLLGMGLIGVWIGNSVDMAVRAFAVTWRYKSGHWKSIRA